MQEMVGYLTLIFAVLATIVASVILVTLNRYRGAVTETTNRQISELLRTEFDRQRQLTDIQSQGLRQEIGDNIRGFQSTTLSAFRELGDSLSNRIHEFAGRLDAGIMAIDNRTAAIGVKLDTDIREMRDEATKNRDTLRQTVETKLDDAATKQHTSGKELRQEVTESVARLQDGLIKSANEQRNAQSEQFDAFARRLSESLTEINNRSEETKALLAQSLLELINANSTHHQTLFNALSTKFTEFCEADAATSAAIRQELATNFGQLSNTTRDTLNTMSQQQRERLETFVTSLNTLTERQEETQEALRQTVEGKLDAVRTENTAKLEEIRKTVDEQLQATLNERITGSFKIVHDQLEQVHRGLGEMQKLADGVGDLKRVLTNVKTRGVFGEVQLGSLMEQLFPPDQYIESAQVRDGSQERVEFALKIPGRSGEGDILLPIDAKFPIEDYERILKAAERADPQAIEEGAAQLEARVRLFAKNIGDKYINPPRTTDLGILFLPVEGLYAELLRRPGLVESLQEKHRVVIAGPTTLLAMLSAFRMSIRAVAIQKRSTEVWQILGAVRTEFGKHGEVVSRLQKQLEASLNTVDALGTRTRVMNRKLQGVESIGTEKIEEVLGIPPTMEDEDTADADA